MALPLGELSCSSMTEGVWHIYKTLSGPLMRATSPSGGGKVSSATAGMYPRPTD